MADDKQILIAVEDLAPSDFVTRDGKVHLIISKQNNTVRLSRYYDVADASKADNRKSIRIVNGLMMIHLDIKSKPNATRLDWVGTLPNECPPFAHLVEVEKDGAKFYVDPNDRQIFVIDAVAGKRYTLDLLGFIV